MTDIYETDAPPSRLQHVLDILSKTDTTPGLVFVKANSGYSVTLLTKDAYYKGRTWMEGRAQKTAPAMMLAEHYGGQTPEEALEEAIKALAGWARRPVPTRPSDNPSKNAIMTGIEVDPPAPESATLQTLRGPVQVSAADVAPPVPPEEDF